MGTSYKIQTKRNRTMAIVSYSMCVLAWSVVLLGQARAMNYENMTLLKTNLLSGYDADMRPLNNQADILNLTVSMTLYQVLEVDTLRGVLTVTLSLDCTWFDERITWNPSDYGGITSVMIQQKYVWIPPLTLGQPVEFKVVGETWMHVTYQSNGFAFWRPGGVSELTCQMNMKYWPFDKQTCDITFFPYDFWQGEVSITDTQIVTSSLTENGEWSLEQAVAGTRNIYGVREALFTLTLKRLPGFYILTLILPLFGMGILTGFVFLLPSNSGERMSYAITILLALTVFLTVISDNIPKLSNPVPLLCVFLLIGIVFSSITTLVVILNLVLYHRSQNKQIGSWYLAIVRLTRCRSRSGKIRDDAMSQEQLREMDNRMHKKLDKKMSLTAINSTKVSNTMNSRNPKMMLDHTENDDSTVTWEEVSFAIDIIMFVVMTSLQTIPVAVLLIILVTQ